MVTSFSKFYPRVARQRVSQLAALLATAGSSSVRWPPAVAQCSQHSGHLQQHSADDTGHCRQHNSVSWPPAAAQCSQHWPLEAAQLCKLAISSSTALTTLATGGSTAGHLQQHSANDTGHWRQHSFASTVLTTLATGGSAALQPHHLSSTALPLQAAQLRKLATGSSTVHITLATGGSTALQDGHFQQHSADDTNHCRQHSFAHLLQHLPFFLLSFLPSHSQTYLPHISEPKATEAKS